MNTPPNIATSANIINTAVERHIGAVPIGKLESHDVNSFSKRTYTPVENVPAVLASGMIPAQNPVYSNDPTGLQSWLSDHLNSLKRGNLQAIAQRTIEQSSGSPAEIHLAVGEALRRHVAMFEKKPGAKTEFSRFPAGLVQLASPYGDDDEPNLVDRTANTIGKAAAVGGAAWGAGALLRGRKLNPSGSLIDQLLSGGRAKLASARTLAGGLSSGAAKVAAVLRGKVVRA